MLEIPFSLYPNLTFSSSSGDLYLKPPTLKSCIPYQPIQTLTPCALCVSFADATDDTIDVKI